MSGSTDELTATRVRPSEPAATATRAAFDEEIRALLRARLATASAVLALLTAVSLLSRPLGIPQIGTMASRPAVEGPVQAVLLAYGAAGLVFLRRPGRSLAALRAYELGLTALACLLFGLIRYLAFLDLPGPRPDPDTARLAVERATAVSNLFWMMATIYYGVLIPNARRRGRLTIAAFVALPFATTLAAAASNPALRPHLPFVLAVTASGMFWAAVIAVYSATRIGALRRQAFEAERRADELGQYRLQKKLGAGGMGEVWLAEHRLLKRPCAVKFVRADLAAHPANAARFAREVQAVTGLTHVNTVRIYDYGQSDDGRFYYVMEYLEGPTLDRLVRDEGPLGPGRAVHILRQLCGALAEAHAAGLVHRDLKPANVIVATLGGQRDVAKLLDFGLVQDLSAVEGERLTQAGVVMGTPAFMCPEQAGGAARVDARGDVYALGAVAFFALTGRPPFVRDTVGGYIAAHLTEPAPRADAVNPAVPTDLAAVVAKCLAKEPADRFASARELEAALAACRCAAGPTAAPEPVRDAPDADPTATFPRGARA